MAGSVPANAGTNLPVPKGWKAKLAQAKKKVTQIFEFQQTRDRTGDLVDGEQRSYNCANNARPEGWYKHQTKTVTESEGVTIQGEMQVQTDKEIMANKPDIIIKDKKKKNCTLIDLSVSSERNVSLKEVQKLSKYRDLETEITDVGRYHISLMVS